MRTGWSARERTFTTYGAPPGRYYVRVFAATPGWSVEWVRLGENDLQDVPIELGMEDISGVELRLVRSQPFVSGSVSLDGKPDGQATVLVFPEDRRVWNVPEVAASRFRAVRATTKGAFRVDQLRSGAYLVVAVPDSRVAGWKNEAELNALAGSAVRMRVENVSGHTLNLNTIVRR